MRRKLDEQIQEQTSTSPSSFSNIGFHHHQPLSTFNYLSRATMSRPPTIDDHHYSPQPEIQAFCTYVVIIHIQDDTDPDDIVRVAGVFMNFKDAVACLKNQRLTIEDGFIPPEDAASRDQHPFRNRIGVWRRGDEIHDIAELSAEEFQELEAEGDIDYVAFGQPGPDNARFDEDSRDFVFKGEKRYNEESGEASKDSASKDEQKYVYSGGSTDE